MNLRGPALIAVVALAAILVGRVVCDGDDGGGAARGPTVRGRTTSEVRSATPPRRADPPQRAAAVDVPAVAEAPGRSSLRLSLVDADTGSPVQANVRLWRLRVPEDAEWTAGDALAAESGAGEFADLVPGPYRAQIDAQRDGADDPPEFEVDAHATERTLALSMPRAFEMTFFAYDEDGAPLAEASSEQGGRSSSERSSHAASWVRQRERKSGEPHGATGGGRFGSSGGFRRRATATVRPFGGFDLGSVAESSRVGSNSLRWRFDFSGRPSVRLSAQSDDAGKGDYVAVVPRTENVPDFAAHIHLPDGSRATEAGAKVTVSVVPVLRPQGRSWDIGRSAPFQVECALSGYERLVVTVPRDGPIPDWTLKPDPK